MASNIVDPWVREMVEKICEDPPREDILWTDIVRCLRELGGYVNESPGAPTIAKLNGERGVFDQPLNLPNARPGMVTAVCDFLKGARVFV